MPLDLPASTDQAMLSNRPVGGSVPSPAPIAAATPTSAPPLPTAPAAAPAALPAATSAAEAAVAEDTTEEAAEGGPAGANSRAEVSASPESRLAAAAARHAIAGRYAEALPVYRELARAYSQNTAYGAMAHVLEQKLGLAPGAAPAPAQP